MGRVGKMLASSISIAVVVVDSRRLSSSRGWGKKKFPSIFAYSANNLRLRSLWHLDELFLTKFPLKLCILCICSLFGSQNIYKNVFSVKLQFSRICNFFHKKKLVKQWQVIFRDGGQEKMWFYCNFLWWFNS